MRVFVAGATGGLGRYLVPGLVAVGHEVTATTRTPGKVAQLREAGAEPVVIDGLDREAVIAAVQAAAPQVIVHQMTALADMRSDRDLVVHRDHRRRGRDARCGRARRAWRLQRRGQRPGAGRGVAAVPGQGRGREAAAACARLARAAARRRVRRGPDDQRARVLEREGKERARLGAAVYELAGGIPCLGQPDETDAAEYRPLLFSIAYGMTGSVGDAEDIVQDAFLGLTRARQAGTTIADPKAYLATAVTRLGINHLSSARMRRETYVGDWLPEPVVVPADEPGPAEHAELADSLSMAFLVLLEALSPGLV
jgi:hypothetical protein